MLKPALLYKEEVEKKFAEIMYDDDYFLYTGYAHSHELPNLEPADGVYQWAIINSKNEVIGYLSYRIQPETDTAYNFGLYSFNRGNPIIGRDVFKKMEELVQNHRRVEWRVIGGNPVIKHYDRFCKKYKGNKVKLHSVTKDQSGKYRDEYWYEVLKEGIYVKSLPPDTPQPKTGYWEYVQYDYNSKLGNWHCSECRCVVVECVNKEEKGGIPLYKYCPQCGANMSEIPTDSESEEV